MVSIIRRNPGRALRVFEPYYKPFSLLDDFEAMAREVFDGGRSVHDGLFHSLDVYREKEDLDISLEDDVLTIRAEKKK